MPRIVITPNPQLRQGHAQMILSQLGIAATLEDQDTGQITAILTDHQFALFSLKAGGHKVEVIGESAPSPISEPVNETDYLLGPAVPGEPMFIRLARQAAVRQRDAGTLPQPVTHDGVIPSNPVESTEAPKP